ncbi:hypothetical protein, partial [Lacrimispora sp.]|uniref:hypothetical protein n=1 Tax=Lacrimispora sp. TaxID=2719234 RepID=UPI002FD885A4
LKEVFAAVFSGELYHNKGGGKCQQLFKTFLFILKNVIFATISTFNQSPIFLITKTRLHGKS